MAELQHCLKNNIRNSSPGPDDIHPFMIKNLPENGLSYILDMYNKIWVNDAFPSSWKKATIVPILKPEKDPTQPSNYRPISLTCVLCKILEKMVSKRLNWFLQDNQIISINQSGFRKKKINCRSFARFNSGYPNGLFQPRKFICYLFRSRKSVR